MTPVKRFVKPQMIERLGFIMGRDEYNRNGNDPATDKEEEPPLGAIRKKVVGCGREGLGNAKSERLEKYMSRSWEKWWKILMTVKTLVER